jgi:hypothetical protein
MIHTSGRGYEMEMPTDEVSEGITRMMVIELVKFLALTNTADAQLRWDMS